MSELICQRCGNEDCVCVSVGGRTRTQSPFMEMVGIASDKQQKLTQTNALVEALAEAIKTSVYIGLEENNIDKLRYYLVSNKDESLRKYEEWKTQPESEEKE